MNRNRNPALALALALCAFVAVRAAAPGSTAPADNPPTPAPTAELQQRVAPIQTILADHPEDAGRLAAFYRQLADVVQRDTNVITTTSALRSGHIRAGKLMFQQTGIAGKHPGLAEAIDQVLLQTLGPNNAPLDPAGRQQAVAALQAISWACDG
jgi:hypothetical protein